LVQRPHSKNKKLGKEFCSYSDKLTAHFLLNSFTKSLGLVPTVGSKTVRLGHSQVYTTEGVSLVRFEPKAFGKRSCESV